MKKLLSALLALLLMLASATATAATDDRVRLAMQEAVCDAAGVSEGYALPTEDAQTLAWMKCWFVNITDRLMLLETAKGSYLVPIVREDPVEVLAMMLAYKAALHDFVEEDVVVFVEWTGMESITVDDEAFGEQVEILLELGYDQVALANVLALRREIAAKLGLRVTDCSFTYYDRYVSDSNSYSGNSSGGYVPTKQPCFNCHTTGKCQTCFGYGTYRNPYTGDTLICPCDDGLCPACDGEGYW